jgi:hypothetical protein
MVFGRCAGPSLLSLTDGTGLPTLFVHVPTAIPVPAEPAALAEAAALAAPVAALQIPVFPDFGLPSSRLYVWGLGGGGCAAAALPFSSLAMTETAGMPHAQRTQRTCQALNHVYRCPSPRGWKAIHRIEKLHSSVPEGTNSRGH